MKKILASSCALLLTGMSCAMHRELLPIDTREEGMRLNVIPGKSEKSPDRMPSSNMYKKRESETNSSIDAQLLAVYTSRKISCTDDQQTSR